jgi:hypothetical protein
MNDELEKPDEPEEPNEPENGPTHLPKPGMKIDAWGYAISLRFHPEIKLDRKRGCQFALALADYLNLEKNEYESHKWTFLEPLAGEPTSRLVITVVPNTIKLDIRFPNQAPEWVETRFGHVLEKFGGIFKPALLLQSEATVRGTLPIDGDARTFLATRVMGMDTNRVDPFGRPIHLLGLKFFFPPYIKKREGAEPQVTDWHVGLRAESLMEDPSKLFLEAEAMWVEAHQWDKEIATRLIDHLQTVKNYLENNVMQFLQAFPGHDGDEAEERE